MKNGGKMLICAASCVAVVMAARAAKLPGGDPTDKSADKPAETLSPDNPYGAIVERNVFDLHDPPPVKTEPDQPKGPPPNIKLTGITTIFGMKQALFSVNKPGAAGKPPTMIYLTLSEGQRKDDVEVLEINPKARTARIKNDEMESLLNIETNHVAAGGPPPGGGAPGAHAPGYAPPPPGTPPGFPSNPYGKTALPPRPTRTDYQPTTPSSFNSAQSNPSYNGGGIQTPYGNLSPNATAMNGVQTGATQQPAMTPLEQYTLMEAQRQQSMAGQADPNIAAIMPPTPLSSPQQNEGTSGGSGGPPAPPAPTSAPPVPGVRGSGTLSGGIYVPGGH